MAGRRDERFDSDLTIRFEQGWGLLRNVSSTGIYFITDASLAPGELLRFTMEFSGEPMGELIARCEARVMRIERQGEHHGIGAAFENIEFCRVSQKAPDAVALPRRRTG